MKILKKIKKFLGIRTPEEEFQAGFKWAKDSHEAGMSESEIESYIYGVHHQFDYGAAEYLRGI